MTLSLQTAKASLALQTPKEYVGQLAAASEAIRRARLKGSSGEKSETLLEEWRRMMEPKGANGRG